MSFNPYSAKGLGDRLYATLHKMSDEDPLLILFIFEVENLSPIHIWKPLHTFHSKVKALTSEPLPYLLQPLIKISTLYNFMNGVYKPICYGNFKRWNWVCPYETIYDDYDGQWYMGIDGAQVFPKFVLELRKNSGKNPIRKTDPTGDRTPPVCERQRRHSSTTVVIDQVRCVQNKHT